MRARHFECIQRTAARLAINARPNDIEGWAYRFAARYIVVRDLSLSFCFSYTWEVPITVVSAAHSDWDATPTHYLPFGENCAYSAHAVDVKLFGSSIFTYNNS